MMYLLNTTIFATSENEMTCKLIKVSKDAVIDILKKGFTSAIGHQSTADLLSQLLQVDIKINRIEVDFKHGDAAIAFKTRFRGEEGKIYTLEELKEIEYDFFFMQFYQNNKMAKNIDVLKLTGDLK